MSAEKKFVLIIEGNPASADMIRDALDESRYEVAVCDAGADGLRAALERPPDLVILEPMLRQGPVDGQVVYRRLRSDPRTAHVPIIICTVQRAVTVQRTLNEKPPYLVFKPFEIKDLLAVVEQAVAQG